MINYNKHLDLSYNEDEYELIQKAKKTVKQYNHFQNDFCK